MIPPKNGYEYTVYQKLLFGDIVEWLARMTDTHEIQVRALISPRMHVFRACSGLGPRDNRIVIWNRITTTRRTLNSAVE